MEESAVRCPYCDGEVPESGTLCATCTYCAACCECWHCDGCDSLVSEDVSSCDNCGFCESCCDCWFCEGCGTSHSDDVDQCSYCEVCPERCECRFCERCGCNTTGDWECSECERCERCCRCSSCSGCGERGDFPVCEECNQCPVCCDCPQSSGEPGENTTLRVGASRNVRLFGEDDPPYFHPRTGEKDPRCPSRRYISCELEYASASLVNRGSIEKAVRDWYGRIVEDGSLPKSGFEVCTAPAAGAVFCRQIDQISAALRAQGASISTKCGYHVHADARDFRWWDIHRLIFLYEVIEDGLFECVPRSRREGKAHDEYCCRCGELYANIIRSGHISKDKKGKTNIKKVVTSSIYHAPSVVRENSNYLKTYLTRVRSSKYNEVRYNALNLHSWVYRGTVECRMAAGTSDSEKIVRWASLWASILDFVMDCSMKDINRLRELDSFAALLRVAPTDAHRDWLKARRELLK